MRELRLLALEGLPEIAAGDDLAAQLLAAVARGGLQFMDGDIVVVAQKIVSKAEGRSVRLADVEPSPRARELAAITHKDARLVECMLRESRAVLRAKPNVLIVEHRLGCVMASAGIDQSNVPGATTDETILLLPEDPDASAQRLRAALEAASDVRLGIIINDSFGRAWRNGVTGTAIGVAGVPALIDMRGTADREGRALQVTQVAAADELAAAASLMMGQAAEGCPAVLARGFPYALRNGSARELLRLQAEDLFR
jgi:coenzyme F420-0:L-glutamate ligase/coenzyme F420-1:gamma-L-glutamate ligase